MRLGEVCKMKNGFAFKSTEYTNEGIPVIRISDINGGIVSTEKSVRVKDRTEFEDFLVEKGDILVAMSGATTGKFGLFGTNEKAYQNQRVGKFKILNSKVLDRQFLYYQINSLKRAIEKDAYGGAQPNISSGKIEQMSFVLPPLPVQHAIVTKIEEIFSELDHGVEQLKTARQQLKVYRQAVLKWAFEGRLTNADIVEGELPEGWKWVRLGSFAVKITDGEHITPRRTQEGVYLLSARNIQNGFLDFSNVDYIPEDEYLRIIKRCNPEEGDILISCSGSIGRVCRVPSNVRFTLVRSVALIKLPRSIANSKFFEYQFLSPLLQKQIEKGKKATAQANLFLGPIKNLEVLIPPLSEQHLIVSEIERRLSVCDKLEETIEGSLKAAEVLRAGVLKRAFEGRLVAATNGAATRAART
ncbi:MAG: restriction endonuclease subunit S [Saprospiraceae bacterium]